jgi:hypothetical protein
MGRTSPNERAADRSRLSVKALWKKQVVFVSRRLGLTRVYASALRTKKLTRSEMTGSSRIVCKIGGLRQARYQTILACLDDLTDNVANYTKWKCYYCPDEVGGRPKHARMPGFLRGGCGLSSLHRLGRAGAFRGARPLVA